MTRRRTAALATLTFVLLTSAPSGSQDRAVAIPDMKVLLQNEHVRVQYHDVAVGVFYSGPVMHRIVNTGNTPIHNLIVELKGVTR